MSDDDAVPLNRAADRLNATIRRAIGKRGGFRFVGLVRTFIVHPAWNDANTVWINSLVETDRQESFHPNATGHRAIARRLARVAPQFFA
jgi:hypothetical protein